ncbi:MAG: hypothetical protein V3V01_04930 [Acidimicrobiales bacterium]
MTTLVLDAGALIALDRYDRDVWAMLRVASDDQSNVYVPTGAIAQAWRDGALQALLAKALSPCEELALDGTTARAAGLLCGKTGTSDVIDAAVAIAAAGASQHSPTAVLTSDVGDIGNLIDSLDSAATVVAV